MTIKTRALNVRISSLLVADAVPLSDFWKDAIDEVADLEHAANIQNELNLVKAVRGWVEVEMCMFCGTTATIEEISALGGLSCCPERRMIKTLVPKGYKDPERETV